jgi:hypothetical protein
LPARPIESSGRGQRHRLRPRAGRHRPGGRGTGRCAADDDGAGETPAADVHLLWQALFAGRIVPLDRVAAMVRPRSEVPEASMRYGLGFWLHPEGEAVVLEGSDAGVSFRSVHDPVSRCTHTVLSSTSEGAWPLARLLRGVLTP